MEIRFEDRQVVVTLTKCVLVMTRAEFIEALRKGKQWRRSGALAARLAKDENTIQEGGHDGPYQ